MQRVEHKQMPADQHFPRAIEEYQGEGVVIGCGVANITRKKYKRAVDCKEVHGTRFFMIDFAEQVRPDLQADIRNLKPEAAEKLKKRFKLTVLECLDYDAYNNSRIKSRFSAEMNGLQNIFDITADDGFVLIVGCPKLQEYRQSIHQKNLNYIELTESVVLIPKDQTLSLDNVRQRIVKNQFICNTLRLVLIRDHIDSASSIRADLRRSGNDLLTVRYLLKKIDTLREEIEDLRKATPSLPDSFLQKLMFNIERFDMFKTLRTEKPYFIAAQKRRDNWLLGFGGLGLGLFAAGMLLTGGLLSLSLLFTASSIWAVIVVYQVLSSCVANYAAYKYGHNTIQSPDNEELIEDNTTGMMLNMLEPPVNHSYVGECAHGLDFASPMVNQQISPEQDQKEIIIEPSIDRRLPSP